MVIVQLWASTTNPSVPDTGIACIRKIAGTEVTDRGDTASFVVVVENTSLDTCLWLLWSRAAPARVSTSHQSPLQRRLQPICKTVAGELGGCYGRSQLAAPSLAEHASWFVNNTPPSSSWLVARGCITSPLARPPSIILPLLPIVPHHVALRTPELLHALALISWPSHASL